MTIANSLIGFTDAQEAALLTGLLMLVETMEGDPLDADEIDNCLSSYGIIEPLDAVAVRAHFDSLMQPPAVELSPSTGFVAEFSWRSSLNPAVPVDSTTSTVVFVL